MIIELDLRVGGGGSVYLPVSFSGYLFRPSFLALYQKKAIFLQLIVKDVKRVFLLNWIVAQSNFSVMEYPFLRYFGYRFEGEILDQAKKFGHTTIQI